MAFSSASDLQLSVDSIQGERVHAVRLDRGTQVGPLLVVRPQKLVRLLTATRVRRRA